MNSYKSKMRLPSLKSQLQPNQSNMKSKSMLRKNVSKYRLNGQISRNNFHSTLTNKNISYHLDDIQGSQLNSPQQKTNDGRTTIYSPFMAIQKNQYQTTTNSVRYRSPIAQQGQKQNSKIKVPSSIKERSFGSSLLPFCDTAQTNSNFTRTHARLNSRSTMRMHSKRISDALNHSQMQRPMMRNTSLHMLREDLLYRNQDMEKLDDNICALLDKHKNQLPIGANETIIRETLTFADESQQSMTNMKVGTQEIQKPQQQSAKQSPKVYKAFQEDADEFINQTIQNDNKNASAPRSNFYSNNLKTIQILEDDDSNEKYEQRSRQYNQTIDINKYSSLPLDEEVSNFKFGKSNNQESHLSFKSYIKQKKIKQKVKNPMQQQQNIKQLLFNVDRKQQNSLQPPLIKYQSAIDAKNQSRFRDNLKDMNDMNKFKPNKPLLKDLQENKQKFMKEQGLVKCGSVSGLTAISSVQRLNQDIIEPNQPSNPFSNHPHTISPCERFPMPTISPSYSREKIMSEDKFANIKKTFNVQSDKSILAMNNDPRLHEMLLSSNKDQTKKQKLALRLKTRRLTQNTVKTEAEHIYDQRLTYPYLDTQNEYTKKPSAKKIEKSEIEIKQLQKGKKSPSIKELIKDMLDKQNYLQKKESELVQKILKKRPENRITTAYYLKAIKEQGDLKDLTIGKKKRRSTVVVKKTETMDLEVQLKALMDSQKITKQDSQFANEDPIQEPKMEKHFNAKFREINNNYIKKLDEVEFLLDKVNAGLGRQNSNFHRQLQQKLKKKTFKQDDDFIAFRKKDKGNKDEFKLQAFQEHVMITHNKTITEKASPLKVRFRNENTESPLGSINNKTLQANSPNKFSMSPSPSYRNEDQTFFQKPVAPKYDHQDNADKLLEAIRLTRYEFINGMPSYNLVHTFAQIENDRSKMLDLNMVDSMLYNSRQNESPHRYGSSSTPPLNMQNLDQKIKLQRSGEMKVPN